jgi:hypothetical protein
MPRVICSLPNASDKINGVSFTLLEDGRRISADVSDDIAGVFSNIPGFELDEEESDTPPPPVNQPEPTEPTLTKAQQAAAKKAQKAGQQTADANPVDDAPAVQETAPADSDIKTEGDDTPPAPTTPPTDEVF